VTDNGGVPDPYQSLRLSQSSTVDRIVEELRRAVFEGDLEAGTPLREVALAESLGVARSTVREALGALVAEGIASREPHRGVWVTAPDPAAVADVSRARAVLEVAGVRRWQQADEAARDAVRRALDRYADQVAAGASYQELNDSHLAVHLSFVGLTGSPRLVAMAESLMGELRVALASIDRARRNAHHQAGSHGGLVGLLEEGRVDEAAAELAAHLDEAERDINEAMGGIGA
jgi:DNA-binding GntR family transcriptional regulator